MYCWLYHYILKVSQIEYTFPSFNFYKNIQNQNSQQTTRQSKTKRVHFLGMQANLKEKPEKEWIQAKHLQNGLKIN